MPTLVTPTEAPSACAVPVPLHETRGLLPVPPVSNVPDGWYSAAKSTCDWILSALLLIVLSPFIAAAALLVKLTSRGPAFYSQVRLGKNGKPFHIFKLRTMTHNCEHKSGAQWATANDPRITPVGRVLRATHLDELPQLWNVLKGEMSLVGPRPERPEFVPQLEQAISHYRDRLDVRPGVTGLAQVQLPADTDIESVRRKLAYDLYYIRHMGLWLDLKLIASTALHVFLVPYALLAILFRLPGQESVERAYQERVTAHRTPLVLAPAGAL
jgi:lipopolysaccharide/colanic/teichoic acid biosynthesis glycosyltransferase